MALTKVTGSVIKDSVSLSGNVSVGGTLTYQDVTNVDALGIGTFRTGIKVLAGQVDVGSNIKLGNAGVITATSFSGVMSGTTGSFSGQVNLDNVSVAGVTTMSGNLTITNTSPTINFTDSNHNSDFRLQVDGGIFKIRDITNSNATRFELASDGTFDFYGNVDCNSGIDVTGNANISGDLDVDGHTNLDNVSIAGVTTFTGITTTSSTLFADDFSTSGIGTFADIAVKNPTDTRITSIAPGALILSRDTPVILFKNNLSDSFDASIDVVSNELRFKGGGNGATSTRMETTSSGVSFPQNINVTGKIGVNQSSPYSEVDITSSVEGGSDTLAAHGIRLAAVGATDEQVIPITAGFRTQQDRVRAGIGFISKQASGTDGLAGAIGFYTRSSADGNVLSRSDEKVRITQAGILLAGHTSSPTSDADKIQAVSTAGGTGICLHNYSASAYGNQIAFMKSRNNTIGSNTVLNAYDRIGELNFYGNDGSGRSLGAQIQVRTDGTSSNDNTPAYFAFNTGLNQSMQTRLRITSSGVSCFSKTNASTGVAEPGNFILNVHTGAELNDGIKIVSNYNSGNQNSDSGKLMFCGEGQSNGVYIYKDNAVSWGKGDMVFHTHSTANDYTTQLSETARFTYNARLAIGNASPQQLLHVWPDTANTTSAYIRVTAGDRGSGTGIDIGHDASGNGHVNMVSNGTLALSTNNTPRIKIANNSAATSIGGSNVFNAMLTVQGDISGQLLNLKATENTTRLMVSGNDTNNCEVNLYDAGGTQRGIIKAENDGMSMKGGGTPSQLQFFTTVTGGSSTRRLLIDDYGATQVERGSNGWSTLFHKTNNGGTRFHYRQVYTSASSTTINLMRIRRHYWGSGHYKIKVRQTYYGGSAESHFWIHGHAANGNTSSFSINHNNVNVGNSSWIQKTSTSHSSPGNNYAGWIDVFASVAAYNYYDIIIEASGMAQYSQDINSLGNDAYALHAV